MASPAAPAELQQKIAAAFAGGGSAARGDASEAAADDPLVQAVVDVARRYGEAAAAEGLTAGLPLARGRLPLAHVPQAAERAGLSAEMLDMPIAAISAHDCPLVLPMRNGSVLIAAGVEGRGRDRHIVVEVPGGGHPPRAVPAKGLARVATGEILALKPLPASAHAPEAAAQPATAGKWLFSALREGRAAYGNVVLATAALNALGLALPLFTMNVYDRVIPNAALDTLAALAIGAPSPSSSTS